MNSIHFHNNPTIIGKIKGFYTSEKIINEPIFHAIELDSIKIDKTGKILRSFLYKVQHLFEHKKVPVLYMWKNYFLKNQTMIQPMWHFDYPYFPNDYPFYRDNFPRSKQLLHIISDNKEDTSNTEFCIGNITVNNLSPEPTWDEIDKMLKLLTLNTFKCKNGEIIEYDNKTLHRASKSVNSGLRLLMKIVFYDEKVYKEVKKIGFYKKVSVAS